MQIVLTVLKLFQSREFFQALRSCFELTREFQKSMYARKYENVKSIINLTLTQNHPESINIKV